MSTTTDVAVTLIRNSKLELLLLYNPKWGSFTLPMTKRRQPTDVDDEATRESEDWIDAAARNVVECLGRPATPKPLLKTPVPEAHFSKNAQVVKDYQYHVFEERFRDSGPQPDRVTYPGPHVWVSPQQILKKEVHPMTHTARDLVAYDEIVKALG